MTTLLDRYVAAAADDFPGSDNASTAREVRAALEDMVEAKLAMGMNREEAERAAVDELGDPRKFGGQFRQEPRYLIGPKVFRSWWMAIKIALAVVIPLFVALGAIDFYANGDGSSVGFLGEVLGGAFEGFLQAVFWVTLTFAIIEFTGQSGHLEDDEEDTWSADDLPEIRTGRQITISDVILSLVSLIGASWLAVRISRDQLGTLGLNQLYDLPENTPVFNPELSPWWAVAFFVLLGISILVSIWSFIQGYWTRTVLAINLVDNALWAGFILLLAAAGDIINPVVIASSSRTEDWALTGENSNNIIVGILIIIIVFSVFDAVKGHIDYRKQAVREGR